MIRAIAATAVAVGLVAACERVAMPEAPEGEALYVENCAACHGRDGRGNGPVAQSLKIKPTDLTRIARQNGGSFPRARVMSHIDGYKTDPEGRMMPEFGLLFSEPTVPVDTGDGVMTPTPRPLAALMVYLESIQR